MTGLAMFFAPRKGRSVALAVTFDPPVRRPIRLANVKPVSLDAAALASLLAALPPRGDA